MSRLVAATLAAILTLGTVRPAVCAPAQAASPFPVVPLGGPAERGHVVAYLSLAAGAGLIGASFALTDHANRTYDAYLRETDPDRIVSLYDETVHYDHLSAAALIGGEVLVATGLYLRFLRPPGGRLALRLDPRRCALALSF